ncbi:MAG: hypothetical protein CVU11_01390 [Bacteroidetes bacterium HGW-Bacteroidetes-6]|jgi:hypothetical protein|nr:MAG: hypothetical protein CVU11_01390 [Bacteroidetes bacterium HGW-Bacteroidetes-6]
MKLLLKLTFSITFLTLASCAGNKKQATENSNFTSSSNDAKQDTDTINIEKVSAVFISPDSLQTEKRKQEVGEEDFYAGADDYLYYMSIASGYLDSQKLPIVEISGHKYIRFVGNDKQTQLVCTDTLSELWTIYFFDPAKKAMQVNMTVIEHEYADYFEK